MSMISNKRQHDICDKYGAEYYSVSSHMRVGVSLNIRDNVYPLNGLRIEPEQGTTGWFIWRGEELSTDPDFFRPLHASHLNSWCPDVVPYLGLPPGWRFLLTRGHEDVWFDPQLLST